jgi:CelD/BcsL family acetyltransferase involved in cellulose biosynthesis
MKGACPYPRSDQGCAPAVPRAGQQGGLRDMRVEVITTSVGWAEIEPEWQRLLGGVEAPSVFLTPEWLSLVWKHFKEKARLFLLAVWDTEGLVGIAPLKICKEGRLGFRERVIRFLGEPYSDFSEFIMARKDDEVLAAIARSLKDHRREWDRLCLREIPPTSKTLGALPGLLGDGHGDPRPGVQPDSPCFMTPIRTDWETYYHSTFRPKRRYEHRVAMERSQVRFRIVRDLQKEPDLLDRCAALALASPAPKDREGFLGDHRKTAFFRELCWSFSRNGWLHIALLEREASLQAFVIGFELAGRYFSYYTTYNRDLRSLNLGTTLFLEVMRDCFRRRLTEFHMLRGWTQLKEKLHLQMVENRQIVWVGPR